MRCVTTREANGILSTWCHRTAWINALFLYACSIIGAFSIEMTLNSSTLHERISFQSSHTTANGTMFITIAFGIQRTRIFQRARVQTFSVEALLVVCTFAICTAAQFEATELSVTRVSRFAATHRIVVLHIAVGILSTVTWVCADFVDTRFT